MSTLEETIRKLNHMKLYAMAILALFQSRGQVTFF